ncbi:peptidase A4 family-domain-containing protein [Xylariaceae sp. FL0255]|nr:peptidase A4 family-domain-containing protein [Xylariaceae sp. FL0255]
MKIPSSSTFLALAAADLAAAATYKATARDSAGNAVDIKTFTLPVSSAINNGALTKQTVNSSSSKNKIKGKRQDVTYSANWCGAVQLSPPSGTWDYVAGTFPVATISSDTPDGTGPNDEYFLYEWVGIDGYSSSSSCSGLIQSGTGYYIQESSSTLFVWAYFYPSPNLYGLNIPAKVGDTFKIELTVDSDSTGTAVITNVSQDVTITASIDGTGEGVLCGETAEWIAENPLFSSEAFPNFSTIDFTSCSASTSTGATGDIAGTTYIYGEDNDGNTACEAVELSPTELEVYFSA